MTIFLRCQDMRMTPSDSTCYGISSVVPRRLILFKGNSQVPHRNPQADRGAVGIHELLKSEHRSSPRDEHEDDRYKERNGPPPTTAQLFLPTPTPSTFFHSLSSSFRYRWTS
mmetsp:Transcript_35230/g.80500  ORF Transcript_35230/g.80500 Transcript_35230/m.80500 type:complete len:112 (+) Transcript_35230:147-482(+)